MGVSRLPELCAALLSAGKDGGTPVAIVERGCRPAQRTTRGPLAAIAGMAETAGVRSPAVVVIGAVAAPGVLDA